VVHGDTVHIVYSATLYHIVYSVAKLLNKIVEDCAFSILHPDIFQKIVQYASVRRNRENLGATVRDIGNALVQPSYLTKRENNDEKNNGQVTLYDVAGRPKTAYGIWTKLGKRSSVEEISQFDVDSVLDVSAVRVIVDTRHECYVAMRRLHDAFSAVPGRFKDYVKREKKSNGYRSLHDTLIIRQYPVEVQVRSYKMHYVAEYGTAAHWMYKRKLQRVNGEYTAMTQNVATKKWHIAYRLGLHDSERVGANVQDSPPIDNSLARLGWIREGTGSSKQSFDIRLQETSSCYLLPDDSSRRCYVPWKEL